MAAYDRHLFQSLLIQAIGTRSKTRFASEAGLGREYVSRLCTKEDSSRPSAATLNKIANIAENGITLNMLRSACGYEPLADVKQSREPADAKQSRKPADATDVMTDSEWIAHNISNICDFLTRTIPMAEPYSGVIGLQDMFNFLYSDGTDACFLEMGNTSRYRGPEGNAAIALSVSWSNVRRWIRETVEFVLFGRSDSEGNFFVTSFATDASSIIKAFPENKERYDFAEAKKLNGSSIYDLPVVCYVTDTKRFADRILEKIFRKDENELVELVTGYGFYTDKGGFVNDNDNVFRSFVKAHEGASRKIMGDDFVCGIAEGADPFEFFDDIGDIAYQEEFIAAVMKEETGIEFEGWNLVSEKHPGNRPFVAYNAQSGLYTEEVEKAAEKYARELCIPHIGVCWSYMDVCEEDIRYHEKDLD